MPKIVKTLAIHIGLFVLAFITCTIAGAGNGNIFWIPENVQGQGNQFWAFVITGVYFSSTFLLILGVHEFGHYFMARFYKLKVSLPYFIPFLPQVIGSMGAVIRLKEPTKTSRQFFDIGIAGPLAGFVIAVVVLLYGFTHLPPYEDIQKIHSEEPYTSAIAEHGPDYGPAVMEALEKNASDDHINYIAIGPNLLFYLMKTYVVSNKEDIPPDVEMIHNPFLFAGFLALFFTSLNLLPIGQLDGGHILYGMVGPIWHKRLSPLFFCVFVFYAGLGWVDFSMPPVSAGERLLDVVIYMGVVYICFHKVIKDTRTRILVVLSIVALQFVISKFLGWEGYPGWLLFCVLLGRVMGVYHPGAQVELPIDRKRKILGWIALVVFALCFSPTPLIVG